MKSNLIKNMGLRWTLYRIQYELKKKSGYIKKQYPSKPINTIVIDEKYDIDTIKNSINKNLKQLNHQISIKKSEKESLLKRTDDILNNKFRYFFDKSYEFNGWNFSPKTNKHASLNLHWSEISDMSSDFGDIKWIWDLNRFTFAYDLVRSYQQTNDEKYIEKFWSLFEDFIKSNPLEMGPNYRCSQEMSFRANAWLFALYYFIESNHSTELRIRLMIKHLIHYARHISKHINFSVEAVKNNHSISEASTLIVLGNTFDFIDEFKKYKKKGLNILKKEIKWQIREDGSYIQNSHNYHRLVIQDISWVLISLKSKELPIPFWLSKKLNASINFFLIMINKNGQVPNYGMNDGSYIFPLTELPYNDYRPVIQSAHYLLYEKLIDFEDSIFEMTQIFGATKNTEKIKYQLIKNGIYSFPEGGLYVLVKNKWKVIIKSKSYKERPVQADMNHAEIWYEDKCIFGDAGTYSYNENAELLNYFNGTFSHNTIVINNKHQMTKGNRFVWYYWSKSKKPKIRESKDSYFIEVTLLNYADKQHVRKINLKSDEIIIEDIVKNLDESSSLNLQWLTERDIIKKNNNSLIIDNKLLLKVETKNNLHLETYYGSLLPFKGWSSSTYGEIHEANQIVFNLKGQKKVITKIIEN
ncbi:hypothetical protein BFS35_010735 [Macrococcoides goetzii]|uniref:Uncharacterized protein n=1 Tax=Macrococcoides goetzii TaxID=1891097 RepID=A0A395G7D6_9STAP|nr:heparinase II/III family protein [Macrococcus goetzii]RAI79922.1 hypothetical protein BFS35_010735 [Macrococcus goetzii]